MLIFTKSRKSLVRRQKAVIDFVNRMDDYQSPRTKEAIQDFQRWSKESGVFKDLKIDDDTGQPFSRGCQWITTFEKRRGEVKNGKNKT